MNRRSFLIGTGFILFSAFADKANQFLRSQNSLVPFFENNEQAQKLCCVKGPHDQYHVKRGTPEYGFPKFTDRGWLATYGDLERLKGKFIIPRDFKRLWEDNAIGPSDLDLVAAMKYYHDQQAITDSPFARAHDYLSKIALLGKENENGLKIAKLDFVAPGGPAYSDNCAVFSEDPNTAKLLQAGLIELGHNTSVEIVNHSRAHLDADLFSLSSSFFLWASG